MAGFPGVVLFKALLLTAFCGIAGLLASRRAEGSLHWGIAAAVAAASVTSLFSADRPALISFVLVPVFIWILERGGPLWLLPALSVVWANSHGGYFLGWVILAAYSAAAAVRRRRGERYPNDARLWIVAALSIALSGLNPSGFRIFEILAAYRHSYLTQTLIEWTRPRLWGPPYAFNLLLYAAAAVLLSAWRRVRAVDWFLFLPFAAASLLAFRNIPLIAFLAPILIAAYFPWRRKLPAVAGPAVALVLVGWLGVGVYRGQFFQFRAAFWKFPSGAADFLLAHRVSAPIFNTYEYGGYLIWRLWPEERVFIDGRALNEAVYQDYGRALTSPDPNVRREVLARYGVGAIVINAFEYTTGVLYPLALGLADAGEGEWRLVYQDSQALVFLRPPPSGVAALDRSLVRDHLEAECRVHLENDPELNLCARTLGFLFLRRGDTARARRWFGLYLANLPEPDPEAENAYRHVLGR